MATVNIKQHDTSGLFTDTLTIDGTAINLTDADVFFLLRKPGLIIRQEAEVVTEASGTVKYQVVEADVAITGKFQQEWEIVFSDDTLLTVPNDGYNIVNILHDLGGPPEIV